MPDFNRLFPLASLLLILWAGVCFPVCVEVPSETEAVQGNPMKLRCISCMKREDVEATTVVEWFYRPEGGKDFLPFFPAHPFLPCPRALTPVCLCLSFPILLSSLPSSEPPIPLPHLGAPGNIVSVPASEHHSGPFLCPVPTSTLSSLLLPLLLYLQIYEYRNGHQEVESPFQGRLQWNGSKDLQDVSITVLNVTLNDSGLYTCNVSREFEFETHRPFVKTTRLIPLRVTEEAGEDFTSVVSEIMMYILLVFLTLSDYLAIPSENKENSAVPVEE
eukprot:bmy_10896T0